MPAEKMYIQRIKFKGVLDYVGLQRLITTWQARRGFSVHQTLYKRKPGNEIGVEEEIKFRSWRKESDFAKYWLNIYIHTWDIQHVEAVKDGKKKNLIKARVLIEFQPESEWDYTGKFSGTWFTSKMLKFYMRYIRGMGTDKEWDGVWGDRHYYYNIKLMTEVKAFLGMETKNNDAYDTMW